MNKKYAKINGSPSNPTTPCPNFFLTTYLTVAQYKFIVMNLINLYLLSLDLIVS